MVLASALEVKARRYRGEAYLTRPADGPASPRSGEAQKSCRLLCLSPAPVAMTMEEAASVASGEGGVRRTW
jgi:hypothetical protein